MVARTGPRATPFTPLTASRLTSIEVAIGFLFEPNELDFWLATDSGGQPGTVIESFHASGAMGRFGYPNPLIVFSSTLQPTLLSGEQYWIYAHVVPPAWAGWYGNNTDDFGPHAFHQGTEPWSVRIGERGAFRVNGEAISEPATFVLLGLGLAVAALRRAVKYTRLTPRTSVRAPYRPSPRR